MAHTTLIRDDYNVAIICPLGVELAPIKALLDERHPAPRIPNLQNTYDFGRIGEHNVVIAVLPRMGVLSANIVGIRLLEDFKLIRFGLLVGIGGGVPGESTNDVRLGDIVVSRPRHGHGGVIKYNLKTEGSNTMIEYEGSIETPPDVVLANVERLKSEHILEKSRVPNFVSDMISKYPSMKTEHTYQGRENDKLFEADHVHRGGSTCRDCSSMRLIRQPSRTNTFPKIHYGTIASGPLLKDATIRDRLRDDKGVLCVEMEAAGLMASFPCLVIRGICDYADTHKNKRWQPYAAAVAAAYAKELLYQIPAKDIDKARRISSRDFGVLLSQYDQIEQEKLKRARAKAFWDPIIESTAQPGW